MVASNCTLELALLTHWGQNKMAAISQTTLSNPLSWLKICEFWLRFHWSLLLRFQLTIFQHWFREWLRTDQVISHYLNQWWLDYRCIYGSLSLNELNSVWIKYYKYSADVFSCSQAALWIVQSVCLSVWLSHLFRYVPIIASSWNF